MHTTEKMFTGTPPVLPPNRQENAPAVSAARGQENGAEDEAARILIDTLMPRAGQGPAPVYLAGVSMGATSVLMATALPLPANVRGVIADCGFTSPRAIMAQVPPLTAAGNPSWR